MTSEVKGKCFVIMPFSKTSEQHTEDYWAKHFKDFIKPLIESTHPIIAERSSPLRGDIIRQIVTDLVTASIVVADLTDSNPNVYWELGVRQSFKHRTITIAESGTILPFDLGAKGTLFYFPTNHIKMQAFRKQLHKAISDCLKNPESPDSHVLETISGRGTLYQILMRDESLRRLDAIISELDYNEDIFDGAIEQCQDNIKLRKEEKSVSFYTRLLNVAAVESLIVNRYIDAKKDFYELAEVYVGNLHATNTRLVDWPSRPSSIEPWLLEQEKNLMPIIKEFKKQVRKYIKATKKIV